MFYISKDTELTTELLTKFMNRFRSYNQPKLQKWKDYYDGKHAILQKTYSDKTKPCTRIVTNYCKVITDTYGGYIVGKPVSYSSNDDIADVQEVINYNDSNEEDIKWLTNALVYGVGYELHWLEKVSNEKTQSRYASVSPLNAFAIYDNTLDANLLYFVRWYDEDSLDENNTQYVEVYDANTVKTYKTEGIGSTDLILIDEQVHYFGDVPVSVFYLNETEENIFNSIISLNDAYNELQSAEVDDYSAFCDAYLALTAMDADKDDIADMKENRVLLLPEGGSAGWVIKPANDAQVMNMLENIKKNIYKITSAPDMTDESFLAQSGTALAYKLVSFENVASGIVARFTKAIQRRIELICNVLNLKASDAVWRDIQISFVRNVPVNITETIQLVNSLKGTVSDATLLSQIPFVDDVQAELEALQKQKEANMALYSFGGNNGTEEDDDLNG